MRTYTVRDVRGTGVGHPAGRRPRAAPRGRRVRPGLDLGGAGDGRATGWCSIAPRRGEAFGGIEFDPGTAESLLLVGDETAVPAVCSDPRGPAGTARGAAFLEVPEPGDVLTQQHPDGSRGRLAAPRRRAARRRACTPRCSRTSAQPLAAARGAGDEVDPDLWETPTYSSSGEDVEADAVTVGHDLDGLYAWIAGESGVVTDLRRHLVKDLGMDRRQVAFMGYWRRGVAMRS